jgi:hypothetical protein
MIVSTRPSLNRLLVRARYFAGFTLRINR